MRALLQDLRYGIRMLAKNPGVSAVAVVTLALGIGANATIFSNINTMLLHPFAFRDLSRAVFLWETVPKQNQERISLAPANFRDLQEQSKSFDYLAALHGWDVNLTRGAVAERVEGFQVTSEFFPLIGIAPELGRALAAGDSHPGRDTVIVLSHGFWQRYLGADSGIIGKSLLLNGQPFTVVGVMPAEFDFPVGAEAWAPLDLNPTERANRSNHYLQVLGSLKPGVSASQAQADLGAIADRLAREYPETNAGHSLRVTGVVDDLTQGSKQFIAVLMGAAFFVLLLACANVANLQLARATVRQKEIAVRRALGAGRWQIARQLLVESLLVALLGGSAGLLLAAWGIDSTRSTLPPFIIQHVAGLKHLEVDSTVTAFTLAVALLAGILAGIAPAFEASRCELNEVLKEGLRGGSSGPGRNRLRSLLVVSEVALALVLLAGAGLMVKGFRNLISADQGFNSNHVLSFRVSLPAASYSDKVRVREFYDSVLQKLKALPGAQSAAAVTSLPSSWSWNQTQYRGEGQSAPAPGELRLTVSQSATPDYFRTLRIPLVQGRSLTSEDSTQSPPVAVISEKLAQRIWPSQNAIGKRIQLGSPESKEPWRTVVGVVGDIKQTPFDPPHPTAYVPFDQVPANSAGFLVRTQGDPLSLASAARAQVLSVGHEIPPYDVRTVEQRISDTISGVEASARMMLAFGAVALVLAAAGIFALMAYSVSQRTHEIGVRLALGARPADIVRMVVGNAMKLAIIGLAVGVPLALALAHVVSTVLFGIARLDALVLAGIIVLLALVAATAAYVPARRATKVDPMVALRYE
jgi:putative ABC transport system permease protein